jgi:hypothetical protein
MKTIATTRAYAKVIITYELDQEEQKLTANELFEKLYTPFGGHAHKHGNQFTATIYTD